MRLVSCLSRSILLYLFIIPVCLASNYSVEVFELSNRDANEVKNSIKDFLAQGAVVTIDQNKIIIKSDSENLADLKQIIAALDVAKKQLKLEVFWGESPEEMVNDIAISTSREANKVQSLYVEDGEMVALTKTSLVKVFKDMAGQQQQLQEEGYKEKASDSAITRDIADLDERITRLATVVETRAEELAIINKQIGAKEKEIADAKKSNQNTLPLTQQLAALKNDALYRNALTLRALQTKRQSLASSGVTNSNEQSNYNSSYGAVNQDFINLPEGMYLKPKMLNDKQIKVDINIVKAGEGLKKSTAEVRTMSQQIRTTMQVTTNKWQKVSGQDERDSSNEQVVTYSTDTNSGEPKVWLRISVVK